MAVYDDDSNGNDKDNNDTHQGLILVREGKYSVADNNKNNYDNINNKNKRFHFMMLGTLGRGGGEEGGRWGGDGSVILTTRAYSGGDGGGDVR